MLVTTLVTGPRAVLNLSQGELLSIKTTCWADILQLIRTGSQNLNYRSQQARFVCTGAFPYGLRWMGSSYSRFGRCYYLYAGCQNLNDSSTIASVVLRCWGSLTKCSSSPASGSRPGVEEWAAYTCLNTVHSTHESLTFQKQGRAQRQQQRSYPHSREQHCELGRNTKTLFSWLSWVPWRFHSIGYWLQIPCHR